MPRPAPVTVSFGADVLCGDVFLSSFELSLSSASPITFSGMAEEASSFPVENVGNAMNNDELDSGSALLVDRLTQLPRGDTTPQEEITRCVKRPVSVISSSFDSPYSRHRKSLVQDSAIVTKRSFTLPSNRLEDIIQCANENQDHRVLVTSASFPYHVEWVSASWSRVCGWSCDEILGLDCKFLQGDATDFQEVSRFMERLMASGGYSSMSILNYNKDDTLQRVLLNCCPIMDDCGPNNSSRVTHIGAILIESREVHHSAECAELLEEKELEEVGMPLDRREGCRSCTNLNRLHPPTLDNWRALAEGLSLAHILRYMIRSQAPIVLTDSLGRIVHVNVGWVTLTGYASVDCEGLHLTSVFDGHSNQVFSDEMPFSVSSEIFSSAVNLKPRSSFRPPTPLLARPISTDGPPFVFYRSSSSDSSSTSSCDERMMGNFPSRSRSPLLPLHLSPVSIGSKHFAIMCFA